MIDLHSPYGIPNLFDQNIVGNTKLIIDPSKTYFQNILHIDRNNFEKLILIHGCEPPLLNNISEEIIKNFQYFDKIFSFDDKVLKNCNNSEQFVFGSCWILRTKENNHCVFFNDYFDNFSIDKKKYKLSFVKSEKNFLPGHKLRFEILGVLKKNYPFEIMFPQMVPRDQKYGLFLDSMFHLTVENSQVKNYFTEKIIDCFMSYTIPIYWGCPNIGDYFNKNGIIFFDNANDLENKLLNLTEEDYYNRIDAIKENYEIAKNNYAFFFDRINEILKSV